MMLLIVSVVILIFIIFILLNFYTWSGIRCRRLINQLPGYSEVQSWILCLEAASMGKEDVKDFLEKVFFKRYTSLFKVWFLGVPNINVSSPDNLEELLRSVQYITKGREYFALLPWLGDGLLTSTGAKWHANRKMLTPAFHFKILETCIPIFNRNSQVLIKLLKEHNKNKETLRTEDFIPLCSLDIISEAAMGVRLGAQLQESSTLNYVQAVRRMGELVLQRVKAFHLTQDWVYNLTSEGREQKKLLKVLHGFTESVIRESKKNRKIKKSLGQTDQQPSSFVDFLLETAENESSLFTDVEIRQEVDTFMFEGHETTSAAISWSLLLLGHDLEVQEKVYNELVSIFGESERTATKEDLGKMNYLDAVIKESLRIYPPVSYMSRYLTNDLKVDNYTVPARTNVILMPYFIHRQSHLYPDPETFQPDRFLNVELQNRHPFSYIPFSGGPRNCIGQKFAMMEMKVIISTILRYFKIVSVTKREGLRILFSPILRPLDGTYINFYPRV